MAIQGTGLSLVGAGFGGSDKILSLRSFDRVIFTSALAERFAL